MGSPSTRGCGLKSRRLGEVPKCHFVTLHARVWIEITPATACLGPPYVTLHARVWIEMDWLNQPSMDPQVTLHARVWIEIKLCKSKAINARSPSTRGCGLKCSGGVIPCQHMLVTLHARVWIEIAVVGAIAKDIERHPPREGVD